MPEHIKVTFNFNLGKDAIDSPSAEIDTRTVEDGGDNASRLGKTSDFDPGETIAFLVYLPRDTTWNMAYEVKYILSSMDELGARIEGGGAKTAVKTKNETVVFGDSFSTATLSKQRDMSGNTSGGETIIQGKWIGNSLGSVKIKPDGKTLTITPKPNPGILPSDTEEIRWSKLQPYRAPSVYQVTEYSTEAYMWKIATPDAYRLKVLGKPPYPLHVNIWIARKVTV